jgi:hypothetical protein
MRTALLVLASLATRLPAQSAELCANAVMVVSRSPLPPAIAQDWNAWRLLPRCGRMDVFIASLT